MNRVASFLDRLQSYAPRLCIVDGDVAYAYGDLLAETARWTSRLDELNVESGSVIGVRADYSFSAVAALLALLSRGAIAALIPRDRETVQYLRDAHATALLELTPDEHFWHPLSDQPTHPLLDELRAMREGGVVVFTSGSTGRPKAALHSIERLLCKFERRGRALRTLAFLLFDHIAGLDTLLYTLSNGGTLILTRRRDPPYILDLIASQSVEVLPTSPSFLRLLCAMRDHSDRSISSLKVITYGSEPMDPATLKRVNERFPNVQIIQKYGTTELGSPATESRDNNSLWLRIKGDAIESMIVDGVLWLRSPGTMLGYLNASSSVTADGWYSTGDLVDVDGEWMRFLGRVDEVIKVGGEKVAPAEVERIIRELDFVCDVLVVGEPHPLLGQVVTAQVTIAPEALSTKEAESRIRLHCRQRLASHHVPVKIVFGFDKATAFLGYRQKLQRRLPEDK